MHLPAHKGLKIVVTLVLIAGIALLLNRLLPVTAEQAPPPPASVPEVPPAQPSPPPVVNASLPISTVTQPPQDQPPKAGPAGPDGSIAAAPGGPEISVKQLKWKNEVWYLNEALFTGIAVDSHPGGQPRIRWPMKDGKFHGVVEEWYPNGQRSTETHYANGLHEGLNRYWNEDGTLQVTKLWKQDTLVSEEKPQ